MREAESERERGRESGSGRKVKGVERKGGS